ncbi:Probable poly(beta-D-mannuronate) O-acetylase [hydrothermal vent metagenome]|uniref:Probable poly(Beta-D-mannuronate) O-acetylase n=1 Tax=hydrothermal vent metagenome TaxID=652676 RepID=A0A1W1BI75_9ZZZZ
MRYKSGAKGFLVLSSLFFYSWWNINYLPLILFSMFFNYFIGGRLNSQSNHKRTILTLGIVANLSLLGYFKYYDFFIENFNLLFNSTMPLLHLALPLAISFFTFQQIAYLVDSYRGETKEYNFLNYALFVTFFPQLIAGPIVHHAEMMPQFESNRNSVKNYRHIATGLFIFSIGLFKKVVIADTFAQWANIGFDTAPALNLFEAWATTLSYTFQLYFDFSGYTDMAIGAALLFNIKLPFNFNSPYKALSIQEFWHRWHMTLSRFLRDYIYIPLGGNRAGNFRTYTNIFITFLLGGIWHGAGWTFVLWGAMHGVALILHRIWNLLGYRLPAIIAWVTTFIFINVSWVFFRANDWESAIKVLKGMSGATGIVLPPFIGNHINHFTIGDITTHIGDGYKVLLAILIGFIIILLFNNSNKFRDKKMDLKYMIFASLLFSLAVVKSLSSSTEIFLYFNF